MAETEILNGLATAGVAVLWYLLRQKDQAQQASIDMLWEKHDADADALRRLELQVAGEHYKRAELDARFERLENAIREEMRGLGRKFDAVATAITERKSDG